MQTQNINIEAFIIAITALVLLLTVSIITILFLYKKKQGVFLNYLRTLKNDHEKSLLSTQLEIQEQTLQHVAREIHDNIGLSLTFAKLNLNIVSQTNLEPLVNDKIADTIEQLTKALEDLSRLSKTLNCNHIADEGLLRALELEMIKIKKLNLYTTEFEVNGIPQFLDAQKELVIFRIIQESINNCIRHANASFLSLKLEYTETQLIVQVHDNGKGLLNSENKHVGYVGGSGLKNMQQRAKLINGECKIESIPSSGTTVYLTIPI